MKKICQLFLASMLCISSLAYAGDDIKHYSLKDALKENDAQQRLGTNVNFYWSNQKPESTIKENLGNVVIDKHTRKLFRGSESSCSWVLLSAMLEMKKIAVSKGGNAVINIKSSFKNDHVTDSDAIYTCAVGTLMSTVQLSGEIVKLEQ